MSLLCFFGHHRSASSWVRSILQSVSVAAGWPWQVVHNEAMFGHDLPNFLADTQPELLIFSNAKVRYLADLPAYLGLHVIRDPRDVLVSSYFAHRNSHPTDQWPELVAHRAELQAISQEEGLLREIECRREQFEDMAAWSYNLPTIYEIKMEQLTADPAEHFRELFAFWQRLQPGQNEASERRLVTFNRKMTGLEWRLRHKVRLPRRHRHCIWPWLVDEVVQANSFRHKSGGRSIGETDVQHHYRSGVAGDWRTYFGPELAAQFKANYNDLLLQLGYEANGDW